MKVRAKIEVEYIIDNSDEAISAMENFREAVEKLREWGSADVDLSSIEVEE